LRIVNQAIMIPLYAIILYWILPRLKGFNTLSKPKETPSLGSKDSKEQAE